MPPVSSACSSPSSTNDCKIALNDQTDTPIQLDGVDCQRTQSGYQCGDKTLPLKYKTGTKPAVLALLGKDRKQVSTIRIYLPAISPPSRASLLEAEVESQLKKIQKSAPQIFFVFQNNKK